MLKSEIKPRMEYAFREKHTPGTPFQHVRVIEHIRADKWKVEWIAPNPGWLTTLHRGNWSRHGKLAGRFSGRMTMRGACRSTTRATDTPAQITPWL